MLEQNEKMYATDCYKIYGDVNEEQDIWCNDEVKETMNA